MPTITLTTPIHAPIDRCFDLARSIDFHVVTTGETLERAIGGRTSGLIGLSETVTWRAKHFGVWQELTTQITAFDRPRYFQDAMIKGIFAAMCHDHHFEERDGITVMIDTFGYRSPLGPLGVLADHLFLERYLYRFLVHRFQMVKSAAESEEWKKFLLHPLQRDG